MNQEDLARVLTLRECLYSYLDEPQQLAAVNDTQLIRLFKEAMAQKLNGVEMDVEKRLKRAEEALDTERGVRNKLIERLTAWRTWIAKHVPQGGSLPTTAQGEELLRNRFDEGFDCKGEEFERLHVRVKRLEAWRKWAFKHVSPDGFTTDAEGEELLRHRLEAVLAYAIGKRGQAERLMRQRTTELFAAEKRVAELELEVLGQTGEETLTVQEIRQLKKMVRGLL